MILRIFVLCFFILSSCKDVIAQSLPLDTFVCSGNTLTLTDDAVVRWKFNNIYHYGNNISATITQNCIITAYSSSDSSDINIITSTVEAQYVINQPRCNGNVGTISIFGISGSNDNRYSYEWYRDGSLFFSVNGVLSPSIRTGLSPGHYKIKVIGDVCEREYAFELFNPAPIQSNITISDNYCIGDCNGNLLSNPVGGTGVLISSWRNNGITYNTNLIQNACPGIYALRIIDERNCQYDTVVNLIDKSRPIVFSATIGKNTKCEGNCNGTVSFSPGGNLPIKILYNNNEISKLADLCNGFYTFTAVDKFGCRKDTTLYIENSTYEPPLVLIDIANNTRCTFPFNGKAAEYVTGNNGPYNLSWDSTPLNVRDGSYLLTITDTNLCKYDTLITISDLSYDIQYDVNVKNTACDEVCNGKILITDNGQNSRYYINGTEYLDNNITNLCKGEYEIYIIDENGCGSITSRYDIVQLYKLEVDIEFKNPTCSGKCDGIINIIPGNGIPIYNYDINNIPSTSFLENLCEGVYSIKVSDSNQCIYDTVIFIEKPMPLSVDYVLEPARCETSCDAKLNMYVNGGTGSLSVESDLVLGINEGLCSGTKLVKVTDENGCVYEESVLIEHVNFKPDATFYISDSDWLTTDSIQIIHNIPDITEIKIDDEIKVVYPRFLMDEGIHTVCLTATEFGCAASNCETINLMSPNFYIPNAITLNGDGLNDDFKITYDREISYFDIKIYERYGSLVFQSIQPDFKWEPQMDGSFSYIISYKYSKSKLKTRTGSITVIK